jgi:SAM-dependent methyltransferase
MERIKPLLPGSNEDVVGYARRLIYAIRRRIVPSTKEKHRLEYLVGPIGFWEPLQDYQFGFLKSMGLKHHDSLLDIGCGPLQGGLKCIEHLDPGRYVGIDLRVEPIVEGYKQILKRGLVHKNPTLLVSNSFGAHELNGRAFDYFWASQVLYHLSPKNVEKLLRVIAGRMKPTSVFYGDIIDHKPDDIPAHYWREFKYYRHEPEELRRAAEKAGLEMEVLGQIEQFGYPKEITLHTNYMLRFRPMNGG